MILRAWTTSNGLRLGVREGRSEGIAKKNKKIAEAHCSKPAKPGQIRPRADRWRVESGEWWAKSPPARTFPDISGQATKPYSIWRHSTNTGARYGLPK